MSDDASTPSVPVGTLAKLFNLTEVRVQQLAKLGVVVRNERGKYDLWPSIRGYVRYLQDRGITRSGGGTDADVVGEDYNRHRARLYKARADAAELEAQLLRGRVHDADAVADVWNDMIANARAKLLPIGRSICGILKSLKTEAEIQDRIDTEVINALNELSEYDAGKIVAKHIQADQPEVEASASPEGEPMGGPEPGAEPGGER